MCYYQSPNRLRSDSLPAHNEPGPGGLRFDKTAIPFCCVGAANRIIPNYIIQMWMATPDNGLAATLYGPSTVSALVGGKTPVKIATTTDYPFGETIRMNVAPERDVKFPLYFRIPGWCKRARITVNGAAASETPNDKGFVKIERTWTKGDVVELQFPMPPRSCADSRPSTRPPIAKLLHFEPAAVFKPRRLPYASVSTVHCCLLFRFRTWIQTRPQKTPDGNSPWIPMPRGRAATFRSSVGRCPRIGTGRWTRRCALTRAGPGIRLETDRCPGIARPAGDGDRVGDDSPCSIRLHEVSDINVPGNAGFLGCPAAAAKIAVGESRRFGCWGGSTNDIAWLLGRQLYCRPSIPAGKQGRQYNCRPNS